VASILMLVLEVAGWCTTGGQAGLPLDARRRLDAVYQGWRFASVTPALQRSLPATVSAAWVSGDFDGDGKRDYAVQLVQPSGPADSQQWLVALLRRPRNRSGVPPESDHLPGTGAKGDSRRGSSLQH
jgi:hypothetical protein